MAQKNKLTTTMREDILKAINSLPKEDSYNQVKVLSELTNILEEKHGNKKDTQSFHKHVDEYTLTDLKYYIRMFFDIYH